MRHVQRLLSGRCLKGGADTPEDAARKLLAVVRDQVSARFGLDPFRERD